MGDLLEPLGGIWTVAEDAVPVERQTLSFPGLSSPVEVYRDSFYVPHVFAESDIDLFMAVGYLQASDRLFQMDMQRRIAKGSLSEILGASMLDNDKFLRSIGLKYAAELTMEQYDNATREVVEAYTNGVNARIEEISPEGLPLEFKLLNYRPSPWTPLDTAAFGKLMGWSLSGDFRDLELKLFEDAFGTQATEELFPVDMPLQLPIIPEETFGPAPSRPASPASSVSLSKDVLHELLANYSSIKPLTHQFQSLGSNNWVVHGSKSATGAPILANDPHLGLNLPSIWYQMRLYSPSYNVYGVSLLGIPAVVIGFNEHIAWGFTNVGADVVDFFEEQVNPDDEMQYLYRGQWKDFDVREEAIVLKGGGQVTLEMKISVHGPIITSHDQTVAMQWTGHRPTFELRALLELDRATNWQEFRAALEDFQVAAQNIVYADVEGNIGIVVNGLYPIRSRGLGRVPVEGFSGDYDWEADFVSFDDIPHSFNPSQGFLVSANQKPTLANEPYLGWSWADRYRAARINEVLEQSGPITVNDVRALQLDHVSVAAREFTPFLIDAFESLQDKGASLHPKAPATIDRLAEWDFSMDADAVEPTLYWTWLQQYRQTTFGDEWESADLQDVGFPSRSVLEKMTNTTPSSPWFDDIATEVIETRDDIIQTAFVSALDILEDEVGGNIEDWLWGEYHRLKVAHLTDIDALSSGVLPRDGGSFTVDVAHGSSAEGGLLVTSGPSWRMIVDFSPALVGGVPEGLGSYPGGQSGNPVSIHYQDLLELWLKGEYQELVLTEEDELVAAPSSRT